MCETEDRETGIVGGLDLREKIEKTGIVGGLELREKIEKTGIVGGLDLPEREDREDRHRWRPGPA